MKSRLEGRSKYTVLMCMGLCVCCREIEYLKKETAQRRAQEESEATHKEETDNLQEKVKKNTLPCQSQVKSAVSALQAENRAVYENANVCIIWTGH